jgi:hypothetical protein
VLVDPATVGPMVLGGKRVDVGKVGPMAFGQDDMTVSVSRLGPGQKVVVTSAFGMGSPGGHKQAWPPGERFGG